MEAGLLQVGQPRRAVKVGVEPGLQFGRRRCHRRRDWPVAPRRTAGTPAAHRPSAARRRTRAGRAPASHRRRRGPAPARSIAAIASRASRRWRRRCAQALRIERGIGPGMPTPPNAARSCCASRCQPCTSAARCGMSGQIELDRLAALVVEQAVDVGVDILFAGCVHLSNRKAGVGASPLLSRCRAWRARDRRDITVPIGTSSMSATS